MLQLVDHGLRTSKCPGRLHIRVNHHAPDLIGSQFARIPGDHYIAESLEGKMRLETLLTATFQDIGVGAFGSPKIIVIHISLLVQHLGMPQGDHIALFSRGPDPDPSHHVLPHVHQPAFLSLFNGKRFQSIHNLHRRPFRSNQLLL